MEWLKDLVYTWKGRGEMIETENTLRLEREEHLPVWICSIRDSTLSEESSFQSIVNCNANEKESESIRKFLFPDDRRRSLGSLLLQKALIQSTFADIFVGGQKFCISRTRENKPFLTKESFTRQTQDQLKRWNYNVSHHGDFVGIVSSFSHLVGVDIVDTHTRSSFAKTPVEYVQMFREQLTTYEMDYILDSSLGEAQQYQRFFIFWALKEAFIKAIGQGLGYDLKKVEFHVLYRSRQGRFKEPQDKEPEELKDDTWAKGEAEVWINGQLRHDWHCEFLPLDIDKESSEPRHLIAVALGPWQEALPSYQDAAWFPMVSTSEAAAPIIPSDTVFPPVREKFVTVNELLAAIHAGGA